MTDGSRRADQSRFLLCSDSATWESGFADREQAQTEQAEGEQDDREGRSFHDLMKQVELFAFLSDSTDLCGSFSTLDHSVEPNLEGLVEGQQDLRLRIEIPRQGCID